MDLDLLDESYPMGKSKLPFKDFGQGGLTGLVGRSNRVCLDLPNLGANNTWQGSGSSKNGSALALLVEWLLWWSWSRFELDLYHQKSSPLDI
jgi:hypothetical protein